MKIEPIKHRDWSTKTRKHEQYCTILTTDDGARHFVSLRGHSSLPAGSGDEFSDQVWVVVYPCDEQGNADRSRCEYMAQPKEFSKYVLLNCISWFAVHVYKSQNDEVPEAVYESKVRNLVRECTDIVLRGLLK